MVDYYDGTIEENHREAIERATTDRSFGNWIDGESVAASTDETFETTDPAVTIPITAVPRSGPADVDRAVAAARDAMDGEWGETTAAERSRLLREWVDRLRDHVDELALLESLDVGKPLAHAKGEIEKALEFVEYYASVGRGQEGVQVPVSNDSHVYTRREPYGVVGAIVPWNFPLVLASWKLGPALAAGNAVVLKPAEDSPLTATRVAQLSAGILPDGVLNVVHGYGEEAGAPLAGHEGVDKLSFTGEDVTGEEVMRTAADAITPVTLELGGKSPFLVFPDADLETAVETVAGGIFYNTGQSCDAPSRVLVHEDVHDEFVDRFVEAAESHVIGDPLAEETTMGPLTSRAQYEKVTGYVDAGIDEGATLVSGGDRPGGDLADGWYVEPTVFDGVDNDMQVAREEIFGPVETINTFGTYEEAIEIANDTPYGLAAGIATETTDLAHRAAADLEAGSVWVNTYGSTVTGGPFGGYKRSGIGRECGKDALEYYTRTKTVNLELDEPSL
ncbi:aldehyde dehydrogenase family protein [Halosolutus amylolyticus]|uniref:Aldehyde dehydrogenase family protein n=1 Tax=Halosolutus amylolyticus TaxID=2932267 RepID=A0ABD5PKP8_9EURY|nr:aldehyde dehydrogenase family protein [Halosolutus amylolyticus]